LFSALDTYWDLISGCRVLSNWCILGSPSPVQNSTNKLISFLLPPSLIRG
jgi:hypothetical protein